MALDTMLDHGLDGSTLVAALSCLHNLVHSDFNLRILLASKGVSTILAALQDHDWDQDVVCEVTYPVVDIVSLWYCFC